MLNLILFKIRNNLNGNGTLRNHLIKNEKTNLKKPDKN